MGRLIGSIFSKQDHESVRFTFWGFVLIVGFVWLCIGLAIITVYEFPSIVARYSGLVFSDQVAVVFGVPSVALIVISMIGLSLNGAGIYEIYQKDEETD